jgi:CheY-like chemotaxis protein/HPt (histidine-containing phosphotransfer) domain-containing protein
MLRVRAEEKGLKFFHSVSHEVPMCLIGDQGRLRQVLINLIGNAIKFCQQGNIHVEIETATIDINTVTLHIRVSDTGIGISQEACERIFKQFEQADSSTTRKFGGTGLGLAISKKLVELMDGDIWVESTLGVGSCFQFTSRFLIGEESQLSTDNDESLASSQNTFTPLSILLADDVEINRALVQAVLEPYGHKIDIATNGKEACEAFRSKRYQIILMDVQMPEMDGLQATRVIRTIESAEECNVNTPIIAMTAFAGSEDRQVCIDAGMNDYLTKPIKSAQLLQLLNRYSGNHVTGDNASEHHVSSEPHQASITSSVFEEKNGSFNYDELLERLGGRTEMIPKFIGFFCKGTPGQLEELAAAVAAKNALAVQRSSHAIKGAAGNISAQRMHKIASALERSAKEGDLTLADQRLAELQNEYVCFIKEAGDLGF